MSTAALVSPAPSEAEPEPRRPRPGRPVLRTLTAAVVLSLLAGAVVWYERRVERSENAELRLMSQVAATTARTT